MKTKITLLRYIVIALLIAIGILGFNIASFTLYNYAPITRGILGFAAIYLAFHEAALSRSKNPISNLFSFPRNIKYFIYAFIFSLIFYWALESIFEMISFLTKA